MHKKGKLVSRYQIKDFENKKACFCYLVDEDRHRTARQASTIDNANDDNRTTPGRVFDGLFLLPSAEEASRNALNLFNLQPGIGVDNNSNVDEITDGNKATKVAVQTPLTTKVCKECHKEKAIDAFRKDKGRVLKNCKDCRARTTAHQQMMRKQKQNQGITGGTAQAQDNQPHAGNSAEGDDLAMIQTLTNHVRDSIGTTNSIVMTPDGLLDFLDDSAAQIFAPGTTSLKQARHLIYSGNKQLKASLRGLLPPDREGRRSLHEPIRLNTQHSGTILGIDHNVHQGNVVPPQNWPANVPDPVADGSRQPPANDALPKPPTRPSTGIQENRPSSGQPGSTCTIPEHQALEQQLINANQRMQELVNEYARMRSQLFQSLQQFAWQVRTAIDGSRPPQPSGMAAGLARAQASQPAGPQISSSAAAMFFPGSVTMAGNRSSVPSRQRSNSSVGMRPTMPQETRPGMAQRLQGLQQYGVFQQQHHFDLRQQHQQQHRQPAQAQAPPVHTTINSPDAPPAESSRPHTRFSHNPEGFHGPIRRARSRSVSPHSQQIQAPSSGIGTQSTRKRKRGEDETEADGDEGVSDKIEGKGEDDDSASARVKLEEADGA